MSWFTRKPTQAEALLQIIREDRRAQADFAAMQMNLLSKVVESLGAQSQSMNRYLDMVGTNNTAPIVRVMDDVEEAALDVVRKKRQQESVAAVLGANYNPDPPPDFGELFTDLKDELKLGV